MRKSADKRVQFVHQRLEHEGNVWYFDGKYDPDTKTLRVYRIHGDVTNPQLLKEAFEIFTNAEGIQHVK